MVPARRALWLALALYLGLGLALALGWDWARLHVGAVLQGVGDLAILAYLAAGGPFLFVRFMARAKASRPAKPEASPEVGERPRPGR